VGVLATARLYEYRILIPAPSRRRRLLSHTLSSSSAVVFDNTNLPTVVRVHTRLASMLRACPRMRLTVCVGAGRRRSRHGGAAGRGGAIGHHHRRARSVRLAHVGPGVQRRGGVRLPLEQSSPTGCRPSEQHVLGGHAQLRVPQHQPGAVRVHVRAALAAQAASAVVEKKSFLACD
jgi:hypothetical protein